MRSSSSILLGLCALVSARCGTQPHANIAAMHAAYQAHESAAATDPARFQQVQEYSIDTYVNVITNNNTLAGGYVSEDTVRQQMAVLNDKYAGTGFEFILQDIHYLEAPQWCNIVPLSDSEYDMKSSLRRGNYSDLNIYIDTIAPTPDGEILGYATFPDKANDRAFQVDGVVVNPNTLPDVSAPPFNEGITLVHEVGHWLCLFHTFESGTNSQDPNAGCGGQGDYVLDTPAEGSAAYGCQSGRDTCTGPLESENPYSEPGVDPIHNYMDYSDDACLNTFTNNQTQRMMTCYVQSRINYVPGTDGEEMDPTGDH